MNTDIIYHSYLNYYKPRHTNSGGLYTGTDRLDCCMIDVYSSPEDLWASLLSVLSRSNSGCHIFIPLSNPVAVGEHLQYPLVLSDMAVLYSMALDMRVINTHNSSTIELTTLRPKIAIKHDIIKLFDLSTFQSTIQTSHLISRYKISPWYAVNWLKNASCTGVADSSNKVDIVFTLAGCDSPTDNEELRIALRSIERHAKNAGTVWIVTDNPPKWVDNVNILPVADAIKNNKDANLINKVRAACNTSEVSDRFIYWSDDQVLTSDIHVGDMFPIYNNRGISNFTNVDRKWSRRMFNTLETVRLFGGDTSVNWDSHVPQPIDKRMFDVIMSHVDYTKSPGLCINTTYFGIKGEPAIWCQNDFKNTYENSDPCRFSLDKLFIGYNDSGYHSGLRKVLLDEFNVKSIYEKG